VLIAVADVNGGRLLRDSHARPGKLFTANETLIVSSVGVLQRNRFRQVLAAVLRLLRSNARA
jgi:hypothetical protein